MSLAGTMATSYESSIRARSRKVERRQWWLWASAIIITLLLTVGLASFTYLLRREQTPPFRLPSGNLSVAWSAWSSCSTCTRFTNNS